MTSKEQSSQNSSLPLSSSQLPFYAGQRLNPDSPIYNMPFAFKIRSELNVEVFKLAFQLLINKTDILRTVFVEIDGTPHQQVLEQYTYHLKTYDFTDYDDESMVNWIAKEAQNILPLNQPLFESGIIKRSENHYIWYINQHHLITDAWACTILFRNCIDLYQSHLDGKSIDPKPFPEYGTFVNNSFTDSSTVKVDKVAEYWDSKYKDLPESLRFYGNRKKVSTTASERIEIDLGKERSKKIRELASHKDFRAWNPHMTYFNLFASALYIFLHRVCQSEKISIDMPFHNRTSKIDKETAGVFIEMFPYAIDLNNSDTFLDIYQKVRLEVSEVFKNIERGASINKYRKSSSVVLNYINVDFKKYEGLEVTSDWVHSGHVDPTHQLRLQVYDFDSSGAFKLYFDLNESIFDKNKQQSAPQHFLKLLDQFLADANQSISSQSINTKEERNLLEKLSLGGSRKAPSAGYILDQFNNTINNSPNSNAVKDDSSFDLTYKQLDELSNQFANYLVSNKIGEGDTVSLHTYRSSALIIGIMGSLKAGATFVPIASNTPSERLNFMLEDSNADVLISHFDVEGLTMTKPILKLSADNLKDELSKYSTDFEVANALGSSIAYMIYTSGSTGNPKGVRISLDALNNYIQHAQETYVTDASPQMALYSMIGFDLTITSVILPLVSKGVIHIFKEQSLNGDLSILDVAKSTEVNIVKLTPSHWELVSDNDFSNSKIKTLIVGGEAFKPKQANAMIRSFGESTHIFNEYGPTEATVGCVVYKLENKLYNEIVPIGSPIVNMEVLILDEYKNPVPMGVAGQLFLAGGSLAEGYQNNQELTAEKFIIHKVSGKRMYATGDFCRLNEDRQIEYLGRKDEQVKIRGIRVELGEIESIIASFEEIESCAVTYTKFTQKPQDNIINCTSCGLPSNYPDATFDENQVCNLCNSFQSYESKANEYFKTKEELKSVLKEEAKVEKKYDCMMLLSGGKDSSYALAQLIDMGLNVLAFTLDNGYISEEALANASRVVKDLKVDHVFGQTEAMNAIFVDSLKNFSNVCNGCFKVLYTLSTQVALEKGIPYIVTGLSRGQFYETRLTEELFSKDNVDFDKIDDIILNARKAYHRIDDAVAHYLDTDIFASDEVFEKVQFLDFYRYSDVSMDEMMEYLNTKLPWIRPSDTGRSTNCLINQVGIYVHKKKKGFSNYAFPYSWDVRLGHKERDAALDEINEELDEKEIFKIMAEIGYSEDIDTVEENRLTLHYVGKSVDEQALKERLKTHLPPYLIPTQFVNLEEMPMTNNGKVDRKALNQIVQKETLSVSQQQTFTAPDGPIEEILTEIWQEVIGIDKISTSYNFLEIGGNSLAAIRINSRIAESMNLETPIASIFDHPTIKELGAYIEDKITALMEE